MTPSEMLLIALVPLVAGIVAALAYYFIGLAITKKKKRK